MKGSKPEPLICAFSLLAAAFIPYMLNAHRLTLLPPSVIIPLFILASSSMAGAVFPAVLRNYRGPGLERKAGTIYGVDLLGGAVSALLASVLAIPVLGIVGTCLLTVIVSALTVFLAFQSS